MDPTVWLSTRNWNQHIPAFVHATLYALSTIQYILNSTFMFLLLLSLQWNPAVEEAFGTFSGEDSAT
jgi:hypothetical protein